MHILKPRLPHPTRQLRAGLGLHAHGAHALGRLDEVAGEVRVLGQRAVGRVDLHGEVLQLDPAAGLEVLEALGHQRRPVAHGAEQVARVDEVELLRVCPLVLDVVDFEAHVGRYEGGLDGAEVVAEDLVVGGGRGSAGGFVGGWVDGWIEGVELLLLRSRTRRLWSFVR